MLLAIGRADLNAQMHVRDDQVGDFEMVGIEFLSMLLRTCFDANIDDARYSEPSERLVRGMLW